MLAQQRREWRNPVLALLVALMLGALGALLTPAAFAQPEDDASTDSGTITWGVKPASNRHGTDRPNFSYEIAAGGTIADAIVVSNYSEDPLTLAVYGADGFLNSAGEIDVVPASEESTELGAWTTVVQDEVTIEAGQSVQIPFRITVPPTAPPGDVVGAVLTSLRTDADDEAFTIDRRLGSRVVIRVDGELRPQLEIDNLAVEHDGALLPWVGGRATITYTLRNTGNITLEGDDGVALSGPFGLGAATADGEGFPPLPPGSELEREVVVEDVSPLLLLTGNVRVTGTNADLTADLQREHAFSLWAVPWLVVAAVVLLLGWAVVARLRRRARRRAEDKRVAAAVAAALAQQGKEAGAAGDSQADGPAGAGAPTDVDADPPAPADVDTAEDGAADAAADAGSSTGTASQRH